MSKSNRKIRSNDVQSILGKNGDIRLPLFIKKNNDEGMDFYYMGDVKPELNQVEETTMNSDNGKPVSVVKIRFILSNLVPPSLYNYLQEKEKIIKTSVDSSQKLVEFKTEHNQEKSIKHQIPLYDFYAAAGTFSEIQSEKNYTLIEISGKYNPSSDYFACKIVGESMNRRIKNGSICLFKKEMGGSRNGKIVLVENMNIQDQDFNSAFTIKTYSSEKIVTEDGWKHTSIVLKPNSYDESYKDIVITEDNGAEIRVVGEFIEVLTEVIPIDENT